MLRSIAIVALCALGSSAYAEGLSYNYVEGRYIHTEFDDAGFDFDGDGVGLSGSFEIGEMWQAIAQYETSDLDFGLDVDRFRLGGGFHSPLSDRVDFVANFFYTRLDLSGSGFSADDDGLGMSVGLRGLAADRFELAGFVEYVDLDDSGDDTSLRGEAWYWFTDRFAAGASIDSGDDFTIWGIGGRYYFD